MYVPEDLEALPHEIYQSFFHVVLSVREVDVALLEFVV